MLINASAMIFVPDVTTFFDSLGGLPPLHRSLPKRKILNPILPLFRWQNVINSSPASFRRPIDDSTAKNSRRMSPTQINENNWVENNNNNNLLIDIESAHDSGCRSGCDNHMKTTIRKKAKKDREMNSSAHILRFIIYFIIVVLINLINRIFLLSFSLQVSNRAIVE